jgi:hypothetical protein
MCSCLHGRGRVIDKFTAANRIAPPNMIRLLSVRAESCALTREGAKVELSPLGCVASAIWVL